MTTSADNTPTFTVNDVADVLAAVPTMFGFVPQNSLIGVATHGPRRRLGFRLRIDVPEPENVELVASMVAEHLRHQGADGAILLAVTPHQDVAADLLDALLARLGDLEIVVCARADGERYWESGISPAEGVPYAADLHHPVVLTAMAAGQEILGSREELVARFAPVTGEARERAEAAAEAAFAPVVPVLGANLPRGELERIGMEAVLPVLDRCLREDSRLSDEDAALLSVWSSTVVVRDAIWGLITPATAADMLRLWTDVATRATDQFSPSAYCLAAFAAWLRGNGAQCRIAAEQALEVDPEYSMAHLMGELLDHGVSPQHWRRA